MVSRRPWFPHTSGTAELQLSAPVEDAAIQKAIEDLDFEFVSIVK